MTSKWPSFVTKDLGDTPEDDAERMRRWKAYNRAMKALIAKGGVHQDEDGWWVDDKTGALIGPDPEIERPIPSGVARRSLKDMLPQLHESIQRARGRPKLDNAKQAVTLRLNPATLAKFKASGDDWRARMAEVLDEAKPRSGA